MAKRFGCLEKRLKKHFRRAGSKQVAAGTVVICPSDSHPSGGFPVSDCGLRNANVKARSQETGGIEHRETIANFELRISNLIFSLSASPLRSSVPSA